MAKRTVVLLVIVIVAVAAVLGWQRYKTYSHYNNGELTSNDLRDNGTITGDVVATPSRSDTKDTAPRPQAAEPQKPAATATTIAPATDSVPANPTNGTIFAGTGRFQVYRQGNLTWRLNTDTGSTCILFATDEEWRKTVVYDHGCGNS